MSGRSYIKSIKRDSKGWEIHPTVFWISAGLIIFFVAMGLCLVDQTKAVFDSIRFVISEKAGWLLILLVDIFLGFVIYLLFSRYGKLRIGGPKAKPEFSYHSWFAMLFSAGMGIGLLFYSVAEPVMHFSAPPKGEANTIQSAQYAMDITFFHWGLHAWGIYAMVGLALAFFCYSKGLPLTIRSVFHPLIGERVHGTLGNVIDIVAVVATLFGLATSLGLGAQQVNAGLDHLFHIGHNTMLQIILIAIITGFATMSVVLGIDKGIRRLSEFNMVIGLVLLLFMLFLGPTLFIFDSFVQNIGSYLQRLTEFSTWTESYRQSKWQNGWTIFYWGWWIAWSPFVGMFIARVSKGRTVREFLLGVLLVPTVLTFLWITVFGGTALFEELYGGGGITEAVNENVATALFVLLKRFPMAFITCLLGVIVVATFFVTSSDSGSLVIDIITAGGNTHPPLKQRVFWAIMEGVVASVLLIGGGLKALQAASILTGFPFAIVLFFMCVSLLKGLRETRAKEVVVPPCIKDRKAWEKDHIKLPCLTDNQEKIEYGIEEIT
ncbi:MAG: BCCT family transporter [Candidatus Kuenenia sp.]|nr:BCCT family transporter [Candidatus Kuenenia hertensis]